MRYVALSLAVLLGGCITISILPPQTASVTKADLAERDQRIDSIIKFLNSATVAGQEQAKK